MACIIDEDLTLLVDGLTFENSKDFIMFIRFDELLIFLSINFEMNLHGV